MKAKYPILVTIIALSFLAGTLIPTALTQPVPENPYYSINYMKVDPAMESKYIQMEVDTWKPIMQQRVKDGKLMSWSLYSVQFPRGTNMEYGFITVEVYKNLQDMEEANGDQEYFASVLKKVHPARTPDDIIGEALSTRSMARTELLRLIDRTNSN